MTRYRNRGGNSGVKSFDLGDTYIKVTFANGEIYVYDYLVPGKKHVEKMKILARAGKGLSTYISRYIQEKYSEKIA
ncbi:MAG: hypothetical protein ACXVO9_15135 [Bacteroidia bacterium]